MTDSDAGNRDGEPEDLLERMGALAEHVTTSLLAPHRLTPPQARVLQAVHRHGPDVALADIAPVTGFPLGAVTSILDRLFVRRLVVRTDAGGPGRPMTCSVTAAGEEMVVALGEARAALYRRLIDGFSEDELSAIGRLAARMEAEVAAGAPEPDAAEESLEPELPPVLRLIRGSRD